MAVVTIHIQHHGLPTLKVPKGTSVEWKNLDPVPHAVETARDASYYFNAGALLPGDVSSPILFEELGSVDYYCRYHPHMKGTVTVVESGNVEVGPPGSGTGHHAKHYHGFVTGGGTPDRLYMSHTPIIADPRHHFQIVLLGCLVEDSDRQAYLDLRNSDYGQKRVDTFHDHLALEDIGNGTVKELPHCSLTYEVDGRNRLVPGTQADSVKIRIEKVLHFHVFEPDIPFPDGLEYIIYGDDADVFIDHKINRAPGFHSVARLKSAPDFWSPGGPSTGGFKVPSKKIRDVSPVVIRRAAIVDNAFHLVWMPPPGVLRPSPQDPLIKRDGAPAKHAVVLDDGRTSEIEIEAEGFLHFDVRLLNYGVFIQ
ncbi:MAG: hypothetical protein K0U74_17535 [Alphaproteobacteria bacterium]|nr:hypothetical protein [Alphaproteobacteria bacterium]